jgi:hypothetical protein
MADNTYDNSNDVYLPAKGVSVGVSNSKSFDGAPTPLASVSQTALRVQVRIAPDNLDSLIAGLQALKTTDLGSRNGIKFDIHLGSRTSEQGRKFDAAFLYLKPTQDKMSAFGAKPATAENTKRIIKAVGGAIPAPSAFNK